MPTAMAYGVTWRPPDVKKSSVLLLADVDPAAAAADQHPGVGLARTKPRVAPCLARRDDAEERRARIALRIRASVRFVVAFEQRRRFNRHRRHRRGDTAGIRRRIELGDRARAAHAAADVSPEAVAPGAERRDDADSADDHAREPVGLHGVTIIPAVQPTGAVPQWLARPIALGGLIFFVDALLYFAYRYTFVFGREQAGPISARAVTVDVILFTVFALHHSIFARDSFRKRITRIVGSLERSTYVWIASALFIAICAWWRPIAGAAWRIDQPVLVWMVRAAQLVGVWLTLRSALVIDFRELAGLRQIWRVRRTAVHYRFAAHRQWRPGPFGPGRFASAVEFKIIWSLRMGAPSDLFGMVPAGLRGTRHDDDPVRFCPDEQRVSAHCHSARGAVAQTLFERRLRPLHARGSLETPAAGSSETSGRSVAAHGALCDRGFRERLPHPNPGLGQRRDSRGGRSDAVGRCRVHAGPQGVADDAPARCGRR